MLEFKYYSHMYYNNEETSLLEFYLSSIYLANCLPIMIPNGNTRDIGGRCPLYDKIDIHSKTKYQCSFCKVPLCSQKHGNDNYIIVVHGMRNVQFSYIT